MSNGNLKAAETWFRLLAEAARGTREARETLRSIAEGGLAPQKLADNIARLLPAGVPRPSAETINQWMEGVWSTTGVVPRSRYLELLERYEALRARLEEAEVTIGRLKRLLSEQGHESDAQKVLDILGSAVGETLKAQAEWMRSWVPPLRPESDAPAAGKPRGRRKVRKGT
jgi:hypothetical protein